MENDAAKDNPDLKVDLETMSLNLSAFLRTPVKAIEIIKPAAVTHGYSGGVDRRKSIEQVFANKFSEVSSVHLHMLNSNSMDIPIYGVAYQFAKRVENYFDDKF